MLAESMSYAVTVDERVRLWWRWMSGPGCRLGTASGTAAVIALAAAAAAWGGSKGTTTWGRVARVLVTLLLAQVWSYAVHRWAVHGLQVCPLWELHRRHHSPPPVCDTPLAVVCELSLDLILGGGVMLPLAAAGLLDTATVIFFLSTYIAGHLIIYHHDGPGGLVHRQHHRCADTNFSPYLVDLAFGTNTPGCVELTDQMSPNILIALCAALAWHAWSATNVG